MPDLPVRHVKTGGDPRTLPGFIALHDEMSKLTHPARPDVNWQRAESLALALFETNGVELQTAAWYTLARSHLLRVRGMNEGLSILAALMGHQWVQMWPQPSHARAEILNGLLARLQKNFRTFSLTPADVKPLMEAEKLLSALDDILTRQGLKHACQADALLQQVRSALTRLENSPAGELQSPPITLPLQMLADEPPAESLAASKLIYVIRPEAPATVEVVQEHPPVPKRWPVFVAGVISTLLVGGAMLWGWQYLYRTDGATRALTATVTPLPSPLTDKQVLDLRQSAELKTDAAHWLRQTAIQLDKLAVLPPDWNLLYGQRLLNQAQVLWSGDEQIQKMKAHWQQQQAVNALPDSALTGWYQGMMQLQTLVDQLNALDGKKGKYITVSELKSQVFAMQHAFSQTIPAEEQLRQMASSESAQLSAALKMQTEQHLKQLITRYAASKDNLE